MADAALYGNEGEPAFPFDIVPKMSWLAAFLSSAPPITASCSTNSLSLLALLDVVLVFGRARTSALYHIMDFAAYRSLVSSLNSVLDDIGGEALQHRRGRALFFITCKKSPLFNWKMYLAHLDVGRNLDYSALGHMFVLPLPPRGVNEFIERTSMERLFVEYVLLSKTM